MGVGEEEKSEERKSRMSGREEPSLERGKFRSKGLKEGDDDVRIFFKEPHNVRGKDRLLFFVSEHTVIPTPAGVYSCLFVCKCSVGLRQLHYWRTLTLFGPRLCSAIPSWFAGMTPSGTLRSASVILLRWTPNWTRHKRAGILVTLR